MRLRTKFSLLISLLVVIIIAGVTIFLLLAETRFLIKEMETSRINMVKSLAQVAKESLIVKDDILLLNYLKYIKNTTGLVYAIVTDRANRVLAHTDMNLLGNILNDTATSQAQNIKQLFIQKYDLNNIPILELALPVSVNDNNVGIARIGFSQAILNKAVQESLAVTRKRIYLVAVTALAVGLLGAFLLTAMMAGPIRKIALGAQIIGQGKLEHKIDVNTRDELGDLANEFNKMSDKLKELDQMKKDFVSSVTHELRSPLISLRMYINNFLQETAGDLNKEKEHLDIMGKCAARLNNFIDDLLDIAKIERGKMEVRLQSLELKPVLDEIIQLFQPQFVKKNIQFKESIPEKLPLVSIDPERTQQVLSNLLSNATKFTPNGGAITVAVVENKAEKTVEVSVKDTGIGIPADQMNRLFNKFEQIKSARDNITGSKGTGLGLAITKGIAEAQGGTIRVHSELNKGSTFTFTLQQIRIQG